MADRWFHTLAILLWIPAPGSVCIGLAEVVGQGIPGVGHWWIVGVLAGALSWTIITVLEKRGYDFHDDWFA